MVVVLAGSGNYVKELANPVMFCSFVEIKRISCPLSRLPTPSSSHQNVCACTMGCGGNGACSTHHSAEAHNPNNILVGQVMRVNALPLDISDSLKKKSCTHVK